MDLAPLYLKKAEERRIRAGHLWVFSNEVDSQRSPLTAFAPGEPVAVLTAGGKFLGSGYVNPHSLIAARILSRSPEHPPGRSLLVHRLNVALALRERFSPGRHRRLVFGESDGLPGLVVDQFGDVLAVQLNTAGMEALREEVLAALERVLSPRGVLLCNDSPAREPEGLERYTEAVGEVPESTIVEEGGCSFRVPLEGGQKTGWYFDQADNRARLAPYVSNRSVLDLFSYVGGFGVRAGAAGASAVTCVDESGEAVELAGENGERNGVDIEAVEGEAFEVLRALRAEQRKFDVVIADPPAFVKRKKDLRQGARAYQRLHRMALQLVAPDGCLIAGSCSYHMPAARLLDGMQGAARHVDRTLQLVERGGQSRDHPIHPAIPETDYLKMFFTRVLHP